MGTQDRSPSFEPLIGKPGKMEIADAVRRVIMQIHTRGMGYVWVSWSIEGADIVRMLANLFPNPYFFFFPRLGDVSMLEDAVSSSPSGATDAKLSPVKGVRPGIVVRGQWLSPIELTARKQVRSLRYRTQPLFSIRVDCKNAKRRQVHRLLLHSFLAKFSKKN